MQHDQGGVGRGQAVRSGVGHGQGSSTRRLGGGGDAHGTDAREREKQEKERVGPGTIPTYVHQADTLADDHKRVGLRGGHGALCSLAT
jgi:hypothetical protein